MQHVIVYDKTYSRVVPKLWKDTIAEHRQGVREAILRAAWTLASEIGVRGVTMAQVAERTGIGRATLYKYFHGVDEILIAAHAEHVRAHLAHLEDLRSSATSAAAGLTRLVAGYANICFHRGNAGMPDLNGLVHSGEDHERHESQLLALFADAVTHAQQTGEIRSDLSARELAAYCVHALAAAEDLPSQPAVERLVGLVEECLHLDHG